MFQMKMKRLIIINSSFILVDWLYKNGIEGSKHCSLSLDHAYAFWLMMVNQVLLH